MQQLAPRSAGFFSRTTSERNPEQPAKCIRVFVCMAASGPCASFASDKKLVLPLPRPSLPPTVSIRRSDGIAIHDATLGARLVVRGLALLLPRLRVVRVPHRLPDRVAATDDVQERDNKHDARDANNPVDGPRKVLILLRNLRQRWWRRGWRAWRGRRGRGRRGRW